MRRLGTLGIIAIPYLLLVAVGLLVAMAPRTVVLIKLDPTIRFWGVATILALPYFMGFNIFERLLNKLSPAPQGWWRTLMRSWLVVLMLLGALNAVVAFYANDVTWVNTKLFGLVGVFWATGITLLFMHYSRRPEDTDAKNSL